MPTAEYMVKHYRKLAAQARDEKRWADATHYEDNARNWEQIARWSTI